MKHNILCNLTKTRFIVDLFLMSSDSVDVSHGESLIIIVTGH